MGTHEEMVERQNERLVTAKRYLRDRGLGLLVPIGQAWVKRSAYVWPTVDMERLQRALLHVRRPGSR